MAIIVREGLSIDGSENQLAKVYKPGYKLTTAKKIKADKIDEQLEEHINQIVAYLKKKKIFSLIGKKGLTIQPYYETGKKIGEFVDKQQISAEEKFFLYESVYHYLIKNNLYHGSSDDRWKQKGRNPAEVWSKMAKFPWETVNKINWGDWADLYMSPVVVQDERIVNWVVKNIHNFSESSRKTTRSLLIAFRGGLKNYDVEELNDKQLFEMLDDIYHEEMHQNQTSQTKELIEGSI